MNSTGSTTNTFDFISNGNNEYPQDPKEKLKDLTNQQAKPCPSCGHCPTCGRGGYYTYPYPYYPYSPTWVCNSLTY